MPSWYATWASMKKRGLNTAFHFSAWLSDPNLILLYPPPVSKSPKRGALSRCGPLGPSAGAPKKDSSTRWFGDTIPLNFSAELLAVRFRSSVEPAHGDAAGGGTPQAGADALSLDTP